LGIFVNLVFLFVDSSRSGECRGGAVCVVREALLPAEPSRLACLRGSLFPTFVYRHVLFVGVCAWGKANRAWPGNDVKANKEC
jgi:hypothetical protein